MTGPFNGRAHRRAFIGLLGLAVASCAPASAPPEPTPAEPAPAASPGPGRLEIVQPPVPSHEAFLAYAAEMRQRASDAGDQAYGAVLVRNGLVAGLGPSRVVIDRDATAHAEMEAIRDASRRLGQADLSGAVLYSTSPPCRMCETAAYWARVGTLISNPTGSDARPPRTNC